MLLFHAPASFKFRGRVVHRGILSDKSTRGLSETTLSYIVSRLARLISLRVPVVGMPLTSLLQVYLTAHYTAAAGFRLRRLCRCPMRWRGGSWGHSVVYLAILQDKDTDFLWSYMFLRGSEVRQAGTE